MIWALGRRNKEVIWRPFERGEGEGERKKGEGRGRKGRRREGDEQGKERGARRAWEILGDLQSPQAMAALEGVRDLAIGEKRCRKGSGRTD